MKSYSMDTFKVAAIQMNSQPDLKQNLQQARHWIEEASQQGAKFIGLPENFAFLGDEKKRLEQAEMISESAVQALSEWAKTYDIFLLGGGYPVPAKNNKVYNRALLMGPDGRQIARYDKIHLFDIELSEEESYRESDMVQAGDPQGIVCDLEGYARIGLSICYDLRFPELYRKLSGQGAEILSVPSAFTRPTGKAHWDVLLRARAIENTAYLIAPAQTGKHGRKRETYGHAMIIDPWGTVLADAGEEPGYAMAEFRRDVLENVRHKIPSLQHRKL